jgi:hypothetical protein
MRHGILRTAILKSTRVTGEDSLPLGITREHEAAFYICLYRDMRVLLHYASYYHEKFVNFCSDLCCGRREWIILGKSRRIP